MNLHPAGALLLLLSIASPAWATHEVAMTTEQADALGVRVAPPQAATDAAGAAYPARVVVPPQQEQVVAAPVDGLLETLLVAPGDAVTEGQIVARLHSPGLLSMQRDYLQALSEERLAAAQLVRDEALFADGIIAERRLLETRAQRDQAAAALSAQRAMLSLSGLSNRELKALRTAGNIAAGLPVRAPRDGIVLETMTVAGQRLDAAAPLLRLASLERLWLEIRLPAEKFAQVEIGARVETLDGATAGRVSVTGGAVNPADETVLVRVEVDRGGERIRPGQFVQARILGSGGGNSFRVPAVAVVHRGDGDFVFLSTPVGFEPVPVIRVAEEGDQVVVRGALRKDSLIAVSGVAALKGSWMGLGGE